MSRLRELLEFTSVLDRKIGEFKSLGALHTVMRN